MVMAKLAVEAGKTAAKTSSGDPPKPGQPRDPASPLIRNYAARFDVGVHDHEFRVGVGFDEAGGGVVIAVGVADEQDLGVGVLEAESFDARADGGDVFREIRIDQDVALRGVDEVDGEVGGADLRWGMRVEVGMLRG